MYGVNRSEKADNPRGMLLVARMLCSLQACRPGHPRVECSVEKQATYVAYWPATFVSGNDLYAAEACYIHRLPKLHNPIRGSVMLVPDAHVINVQAVYLLGTLKPPSMMGERHHEC